MENSFTAVFEKVDDWYIGYVQELPGANVQEITVLCSKGKLAGGYRTYFIIKSRTCRATNFR